MTLEELNRKVRLHGAIADAFFIPLVSSCCRHPRLSFRQKCRKTRGYIRDILNVWR